MAEKRALQAAILIFGLVPVLGGLFGAVTGYPGEDGGGFPAQHYRYLSGLLLGIGLAFYACIPAIERRGPIIATLAAIVFLGGLARFGGHLLGGDIDGPSAFALVMELAVTPAIALWQRRVAARISG